jgi:hypothetical protein
MHPPDRNSAARADSGEPRRSVVEATGQDCPDHMDAARNGRAPEQRIDGGPSKVFLWTPKRSDAIVDHDEMPIRRRDVDPPLFEQFAVLRVVRRQRPRCFEHAGQNALVRPDVQNDENGGGQMRRQCRHDFPQCVDTAC